MADTIVAIATPPGRGGIGIVRVSGPAVAAVARGILGALPPPRRAVARHFRDARGESIDAGLAIYFPRPGSFTGEDVLELHGHGGAVVLDLLVARCLELGARPARAGEFSERAFLNDKLDLAQAEAIADLIDAGSAAAARAALRSLDGEFSARVHALEAGLVEVRVHVEAAIDFAEEDLELIAESGVARRLASLAAALDALAAAAEQGRLLQEGCTVVIAGRPNAGKSSLLNALAGHDAAIVTEIPGTTRDVLRERIDLDGLPLELMDTAGLREDPQRIEAEGIRRARAALARADHVLYVVDSTDPQALAALPAELEALGAGIPVSVVYNKTDRAAPPAGGLPVSALTGAGTPELRAHLKAALGYLGEGAGTLSARRRHRDALGRVAGRLAAARAHLNAGNGSELVAEELRLAHDVLGEITGRFTSEDLLTRIFASFCIGK
ncbi:MAG TPA: tRNA uridine-5-carboxymethylaminomethyl(34) synthesis GTPase MnmE [Steroidobacteraceae bacterium]|nr:tRNA uridine-5-carboxymethylaminomethyl(34) synthesis GTPase MnmE [Steroidobacteraceae bacterium]